MGIREWEVPTDWTYLGHGEWAPPEEQPITGTVSSLDKDPEWVYKWRCSMDEDIKLHQEVMDKGYPNIWGGQEASEVQMELRTFRGVALQLQR